MLESNPALSPDRAISTNETPLASVEGPAWNNSQEYPSIDSNEFLHDQSVVADLKGRIENGIALARPLMAKVGDGSLTAIERDTLITALQAIYELSDHAWTVLGNLMTYVHCETSLNAKNALALRLEADLAQKMADLEVTLAPVQIFLTRAPEDLLKRYLEHPRTAPEEFSLRRARLQVEQLLSEPEETLLASMRTHGPQSWGRLYDQISGGLRCRLDDGANAPAEVGLAQAAGLLRDVSEAKRKSAWTGIQNAWRTHETAAAAILNGLAGWRLEEYKRRSVKRKIGFLEDPIFNANIRQETLDALMESVWNAREIGHRAMRAMARGMGKAKMDPWDLLAPAPVPLPTAGTDARRSFKEGLHMIREAFVAVDPTLGDFVDTMEKNRWIEGRVLPSKRQGAYCTRFSKSRTPRVYQTYMGSTNDIRTLAHELGHAYHAWVMRDLPNALHGYPMTLAETASIFAETALSDQISRIGDASARFEIEWENAATAAMHLLNIPARFDFESAFYARREKTAFVSAQELGDLTSEAWHRWYADSLSTPDRQYWMTKLHFSMAWRSFYNFPYVFGSLFSLSIYARREQMGTAFLPMYIALLRDTGAMTAEDLAMKHLGEDISKPEFWQKSLAIIEKNVGRFERSLEPLRLQQ